MNFAILGAGSIANKLAEAVNGLRDQGVCPYAVASRDLLKAQVFAGRWNFEKAYGSYEELLSDPAVDLVYIATPHSFHAEQAKLALTYGKAVLCEKAFTANAAQAEEVLRCAEEKNLFIAEAIWTRYMPSRQIINELLASGTIGEVKGLMANLGYEMTRKERLCRPELAGGALLDVGVYPLNFASMILGDDIQSVTSAAVLTDQGVDAQNSEMIIYRDGRTATLHSSMVSETDRNGVIYGTDGYLVVQNINNPEKIRIYGPDHKLRKNLTMPEQINGYEYEVLACKRALEAGQTECEEMPHAETLRIMHQMDALRAQWGVKYPFE